MKLGRCVMKKAIICGASTLGEIAFNILKNRYNICYFSDNDKNKWNKKFLNLNIISPIQLKEFHDCKIIIASMYYAEIGAQLKKMNFNEVYVFSYCDNNDRSFKKRYSVDKISDSNFYRKDVYKRQGGIHKII